MAQLTSGWISNAGSCGPKKINVLFENKSIENWAFQPHENDQIEQDINVIFFSQ